MSNTSETATATGFTAKRFDDMESIHGGAVKLAAAELGIESFGMQVFDFPAGFENYPEHDHSDDGQEEVYVVLRGSAELRVDGESVHAEPGNAIRVAAGSRRKLTPGADGVRILAIGCSTDQPYTRPADFQTAAPR